MTAQHGPNIRCPMKVPFKTHYEGLTPYPPPIFGLWVMLIPQPPQRFIGTAPHGPLYLCLYKLTLASQASPCSVRTMAGLWVLYPPVRPSRLTTRCIGTVLHGPPCRLP